MKRIIKMTKEGLEKHFIADPYKGEIISRRTYKPIGCISNGYYTIALPSKLKKLNPKGHNFSVRRSRMIWTLINGTIKGNELIIDHINGIKTDDRINNLRLVSCSQNHLNPNDKLRSNNKSGHTGVYFDKYHNKWQAYIKVNEKKQKKLFKTKTEAIEQRIAWELKIQNHIIYKES